MYTETMRRRSALYLLISHFVLNVYAQDIPLPIQIAASTTHYGPDGPWQAVSVSLGKPLQQLDLYPGSTFETIILAQSVCKGVKSICGTGGLFDPSASSTIDDSSIAYSGHSFGDTVDWTIGAMLNRGNAIYVMDQLTLGSRAVTVPNISIRMMESVNTTYPDGATYPLQVGQLALGASIANQSFSMANGPSINASLTPNYLQRHGYIPTSSYGMHIGSAALNLPLSLWLGGYDMSRVLGPVSAQPYSANITNNNFLIDLLDIGVGVEYGGSPFSYQARQGLLAEKNSSITSLSVAMNSAAPYMYLPNSTCAALTRDLPVVYSTKYGLYLWNVTDPQYAKVITAPTYLSFVFRTAGQNLTIKVPFQLLNLTLDSPMVDSPTPYFPCTTPQDSPFYSLGRAFLQAAFIGVDWDQGLGQWFLAQAPGPNTASNPLQTPITGIKLESSNTDWSDTWKPLWTALPAASANTTSSTDSNAPATPTHLSTGAYAGIGVGIASLVLALLVAAVYFYGRRRKDRSSRLLRDTALQSESKYPEANTLHTSPPLQEAPVHPVELSTREYMSSELGGTSRWERPPQEMPASG